ncbi:MAG: ABC transporter substrate-binding protein [Myxococcota bacterium]
MKAQVINGVGLAGALMASAAAVLLLSRDEGAKTQVAAEPDAPDDRADAIVDARGRLVPVKAYERILSLNPVSDHILLELIEPERLVGVTRYTLDTHPERWRFGQRPGFVSSKGVERVLDLRPDLVVISKYADEAFMARLRETQIHVFDLGELLGVETTVDNIRTLSKLLGIPARGVRLERDYVRNLKALEQALEGRERPPGIYLSVYGGSLFGGTRNTSYQDLLYFGGVKDMAPAHGFAGWPQYSAEEIIAIDPPLVVTPGGFAATICRHAVLERIAACQPGGRVLELPEKNHGDPGLGLVNAAQDLQRLVFGIDPRFEDLNR